MRKSVYAPNVPGGAHSVRQTQVKAGSGKLLDSVLGLCAEVGIALGITAIGFVLSLLCGW